MVTHGYEAKSYFDVTALASTPDTGTWTELTCIKNVSLSDVRDQYETSKRGGGQIKTFETTMRQVGVTLDFDWDTQDEGASALRTAYKTNAMIALAFMDRDISVAGADGIAGNWKIAEFPRDEQLAEGLKCSLTIVPHSLMEDYTVAGV